VFAGTALLLAVAGLYGVMAYSVSRRTAELGQGSPWVQRPECFRLVLWQGLVTALIGVAIGIAGAVVLTRTLRSFLFGLSPTIPEICGRCLAADAGGLLACYFPLDAQPEWILWKRCGTSKRFRRHAGSAWHTPV